MSLQQDAARPVWETACQPCSQGVSGAEVISGPVALQTPFQQAMHML